VKGVSEMNKKLLIFKRKKAKELHKKYYIRSSIVNNMEVRLSVPPSFQTQPLFIAHE
jgi:hypothetical protein